MGIVFTRAWEDDRLDVAVLGVAPGDRVLVVAGAGDTALALAAEGAIVTAVDTNLDQLRLVALKRSAAAVLDQASAHRLFEAGRDPDAVALYRVRLRPGLMADDAAYWDPRIAMFATGMHTYAGVGRPFARLGRIVRIVRPDLAGAIERVPDTASQAAWWRRNVRPLVFGPPFHWLASHTGLLAPLAPDRRELARMRAGHWSVGLVDRVDAIVATVLVRRHPWWRPVFSGRPADLDDGAAWLDAPRLAALAAGPARLDLVHGDLIAVLREAEPGSFSAISVSNVPDWLDPVRVGALASAVRIALAPGGRVLVRRVVRPHGTDPFAAVLARDPLSDSLVARERTALYEAVDLYRAGVDAG